MSGSDISWTICKSAPRSRQTTMPAPHHSVFYRPDALPVAQPKVSKHWRQSPQLPRKLSINVAAEQMHHKQNIDNVTIYLPVVVSLSAGHELQSPLEYVHPWKSCQPAVQDTCKHAPPTSDPTKHMTVTTNISTTRMWAVFYTKICFCLIWPSSQACHTLTPDPQRFPYCRNVDHYWFQLTKFFRFTPCRLHRFSPKCELWFQQQVCTGWMPFLSPNHVHPTTQPSTCHLDSHFQVNPS